MNYIVYREYFENGTVERWFYGEYESRNKANAVALMLEDSCVCPVSDIEELNILNYK